jgi:hypothetical protein
VTAHLVQRGDCDPTPALIAVGVFGQSVDPEIGLQICNVNLQLCQLIERHEFVAAKPAVSVDLIGQNYGTVPDRPRTGPAGSGSVAHSTIHTSALVLSPLSNSCSRFTISKIEPLARLQVSKTVSRRRF